MKRKLKDLTSRTSTWMDEYNRLTTLNAIVRGWAEYYRYTSFVRDIGNLVTLCRTCHQAVHRPSQQQTV